MRTDIPVTDSSDFRLRRAEAKRQTRAERNRRVFGQTEALVDYAALTVPVLLDLARNRGFKVNTKTRKTDLVKMLIDAYLAGAAS